MIHVQIARQVTRSGVEGQRWVLVEPGEPAPELALPAVAAAAAVAEGPAGVAAERTHWTLGLAKAGMLGLGLGAALWAGQLWLGPVTAPGLAANRLPELAVPATPVRGAASPDAPALVLPAATLAPAASTPADAAASAVPPAAPTPPSATPPATPPWSPPARNPAPLAERPAAGVAPGTAPRFPPGPAERPLAPPGPSGQAGSSGSPMPGAPGAGRSESPAAPRPAPTPMLPASAPLVTAELR